MIGRVRESRNPKKVIRVTLMESYGEIGRVPVNLYRMDLTTNMSVVVHSLCFNPISSLNNSFSIDFLNLFLILAVLLALH